MGEAADRRSVFHLRLSNPHLATGNPNPQQRKASDAGETVLVVRVEVWNDGPTTI